MAASIKYIVGDKRKRPIMITPAVIVNGVEFVATESMTMREAQEVARALVGDAHPINEQATKKYHEDIGLEDLMRNIRQYDE